MEAIKVENLTKHYDNFVLDKISFTVPGGVIVGFIGENGAGKTTAIKAMLGLILKDGGSTELLGHTAEEKDLSWKEELGVVFDESYFPENITPLDVEKIMKKIYRTWDSEKYRRYLTQFSVPEKTRFKDLSRGMKAKLSIAVALSHDTKLLILDEATSGLDPAIRSEILDIFLEFIQDEEHTVFLSSHIVSDIEKVSDYILLIHQGKILLYENKDELIHRYGMLRCNAHQFEQIDAKHRMGYRKNAFGYEVLVDNREEMGQTGGYVVDRVTLEELLLFMIKGERQDGLHGVDDVDMDLKTNCERRD